MSDLLRGINGLDCVVRRAREAGKTILYSALIKKMQESGKDSLAFEEIKAVFEEVQNNARKES